MSSKDVQDFYYGLRSSSHMACKRVLEGLRWRFGYDSPHSPYAFIDSHWSLDRGRWQEVPLQASATVRQARSFRLIDSTRQAAQQILDTGTGEPLAHQLLREAQDVALQNPRSALVIGLAAVEAGFKALVGDLIPDASWMVENVPSPPLVRMLKDYLPTLPARNDLDGRRVAAPKYVRTLMTNAVEERNRVVHVGRSTFTSENLRETLDAARDLLYLFDLYAGNGWARDQLSAHFLAAARNEASSSS
ncbi:hypothetical protein [Aquipuribacter sp. SD81]|uniref:hypothetical protein n=1 Tax=Aquipuribacter sp. SD81 TaxID=3127703 RepID=UPI0030198BB7